MQLVQIDTLVQFSQGDVHALHIPSSTKWVSSHEQFYMIVRGPAIQLVQAVALVQFTQGGVHAVHIPLSS